MPNRGTDRPQPIEKTGLAAVANLLGAPSTFRKAPQSPLEAHETLLDGLPSGALLHLVRNLVFLRWDDSFTKAIGMSHRTCLRHASARAKPLSSQLSGRTWRKRSPFSAPSRKRSNGWNGGLSA